MSQFISAVFVLAILVVVFAYFKGATAEVTAVGSAVKDLVLAATGRNAQGQFANYPK